MTYVSYIMLKKNRRQSCLLVYVQLYVKHMHGNQSEKIYAKPSLMVVSLCFCVLNFPQVWTF